MIQLDKTDLELLIILQEKPTANDSTLARLVNLSNPTIKRRIDKLYDSGVIERIQALLNYQILKLNIASVFISIPYKNIQLVQEKITNHPYSYYNIRCIGRYNGFHATFRVHDFGISLTQYFKKLKNSGLITDYCLYLHDGEEEIRSKPQFVKYDSINNEWHFDFIKWVNVSPDRFHDIDEPIKSEKKIKLKDLDKTDLEILSILSLNSRIKNVDILNLLTTPISPQRLSDRLRFLRKYLISNYRVYLNWNSIFSFMGLILDCKANSKEKQFFSRLLRVNPPPFESIYREKDDGFLFYLICPPNHIYPAIDAINSHLNDVEVYILNYASTKRVQLNSKAFDEEKALWIPPDKLFS
jgi:DNA-binding Lrp family transcriptional regulator